MTAGGTGLGVMVAAAGTWSAALAAFALRRALKAIPEGRGRRLGRGVLLAYAGVSMLGFGVGFALAGGSAGRRLGLGFVGVAMSWLLIWFVTMVVVVARAGWATAHYAERVRPISPPGDRPPG